MGQILYKIIDGVVLTFCLPFYLVVIPIGVLIRFCKPRLCKLRSGQVIEHWQTLDIRDELRVVDVSRLDRGLVGFQQRTWHVRSGVSPPDFSETVEYCTLDEFWFGRLSRIGIPTRA